MSLDSDRVFCKVADAVTDSPYKRNKGHVIWDNPELRCLVHSIPTSTQALAYLQTMTEVHGSGYNTHISYTDLIVAELSQAISTDDKSARVDHLTQIAALAILWMKNEDT